MQSDELQFVEYINRCAYSNCIKEEQDSVIKYYAYLGMCVCVYGSRT